MDERRKESEGQGESGEEEAKESYCESVGESSTQSVWNYPDDKDELQYEKLHTKG